MTAHRRPRWQTTPFSGEAALLDTVLDAVPALTVLLERYWQSERNVRRSVGLGLYIAKGITEAHGGRVWAESEPGHGATFFVAIPSSAAQAAAGAFPLPG